MKTEASRKQLEELADEVFEVIRLVAAIRSRSKASGPEEVTEAEFVVLDLLVRHDCLTVGEIQKQLGVLPAQMSRVLRSLEDKDGRVLVQCAINPRDRRKVDVTITEDGKAAHDRFRTARRSTSMSFLKHLQPEDRDVFMRIIRSWKVEIAKLLPKS